MENDQLVVDIREKNKSLKKFSAKMTNLELQLLDAKAKCGDFNKEEYVNSEPDMRENINRITPKKPDKKKVGEKIKGFFGTKLPLKSSKKKAA